MQLRSHDERTDVRAAAGPASRLPWAVLLVTLAWAPWPLGSNRPWALALMALLLSLTVLGLPTLGWAPLTHRLQRARWPLAALLGLGVLAAAQWLIDTGPLATADAFATQAYLLRTLAYTAAFTAVVSLASTEQRVRTLLGLLLAVGVLQAFVAVLVIGAQQGHQGGSIQLFFTPLGQMTGRASGTFPNADHLAGYMELCLAAGLGLMVSQMAGSTGSQRPRWQARVQGLLQFVLSTKMLVRLLLVVLVIALVMTHSRMGNGAFFITLLVVGGIVAWRSPVLRQPALWLVGSMVLVDVLVIGQWVGLEKVVNRLQGTELNQSQATTVDPFANEPVSARVARQETLEQRLRAPRAALGLVAVSPWTGHGGGAFEAAFPPFKTEDVIPYHFDYTHNDYVQQATEVGLLGLVLWLTVGLAAGWRAWRLLGPGQPRLNRGVAVATLTALCSLGFHSLVDFNLQIPANALTMTVLLALPFAVCTPSGRSRTASP
ncbi:O-antigen ligase family protein [Ideonella sp. B7]|uniref:O-antigen ligase family protein n=1 Tax=Ideonella benzenivorans TaxID=2831643 RepID=UPI001CECADB2|nr:O-antigen ligase family protein [Ideonella benzenivorans]MCA6218236.1 O-antigen ligase family protein [Ideonella benzenivorans]